MKRAHKPGVNPSLCRAGDAIDRGQFLGAESKLPDGTQILAQLLDAAGPDEYGGHTWIAQHPGDGELRESLSTGAR